MNMTLKMDQLNIEENNLRSTYRKKGDFVLKRSGGMKLEDEDDFWMVGKEQKGSPNTRLPTKSSKTISCDEDIDNVVSELGCDISLVWSREVDEDEEDDNIDELRYSNDKVNEKELQPGENVKSGPNRIYIGSKHSSSRQDILKKLDITTVVNCTLTVPCWFQNEDVDYMRVPISDDVIQRLGNWLKKASKYIENANGKNILVHCSRGVSRSVTIVIGWLIYRRSVSLREAYELVCSRRPNACPNSGFMEQLIAIEKAVLGTQSVTAADLDPCPVCLKLSFDKSFFDCGHPVCVSCFAKRKQEAEPDEELFCSHCIYSNSQHSRASIAGEMDQLREIDRSAHNNKDRGSHISSLYLEYTNGN